MRTVFFPKGLKLECEQDGFEFQEFRGYLNSKLFDGCDEIIVVFPDIFLWHLLFNDTNTKTLDCWSEEAQKVLSVLGAQRSSKLILTSCQELAMSEQDGFILFSATKEAMQPELTAASISLASFLSGKQNYTRLRNQLQLVGHNDSFVDYLAFLASENTTSALTKLIDRSMDTENSIEKYIKQVSSYQEQVKALNESLDAQHSQNKEVAVEVSTLMSENEALKSKYEECRTNLGVQVQENKEIKSIVKSLTSENDALRLKNKDLDSLNTELRNNLKHANDTISKISVDKATLEARYSEMATLAEHHKEVTAELNILKSDKEALDAELQTLRSDRAKLDELSLSKRALSYDLRVAISSNTRCFVELNQLLDKNTKLISELSQSENELAATELNLKNLTLALDKEKANVRQINKKLQQRINLLQKDLETGLARQNSLSDENSRLKEESKVLFLQLTRNQLQNAVKNEELVKEVDQLVKDKRDILSKFIIASRENTKLMSRFNKLKLNYNVVCYEKFLLGNQAKANESMFGKAKMAVSKIKQLRRKSFFETLKKDTTLIATSEYFDIEWYLETYKDVKDTGVNPAEHYLLYGATEARMPSSKFDTIWYLERYPDVKDSGINPLLHFIKYGIEEGRTASPKLLERQNIEK